MTTTIQSIGRVAVSIPEVTEVCLHGLTTLLSNKDGMIMKCIELWLVVLCVFSSIVLKIPYRAFTILVLVVTINIISFSCDYCHY